jgi:hypothetical protein
VLFDIVVPNTLGMFDEDENVDTGVDGSSGSPAAAPTIADESHALSLLHKKNNANANRTGYGDSGSYVFRKMLFLLLRAPILPGLSGSALGAAALTGFPFMTNSNKSFCKRFASGILWFILMPKLAFEMLFYAVCVHYSVEKYGDHVKYPLPCSTTTFSTARILSTTTPHTDRHTHAHPQTSPPGDGNNQHERKTEPHQQHLNKPTLVVGIRLCTDYCGAMRPSLGNDPKALDGALIAPSAALRAWPRTLPSQDKTQHLPNHTCRWVQDK